MAFGGSIIDASVAGLLGGIVTFLNLYAVNKSEVFAVIYELSFALSFIFSFRCTSALVIDQCSIFRYHYIVP